MSLPEGLKQMQTTDAKSLAVVRPQSDFLTRIEPLKNGCAATRPAALATI